METVTSAVPPRTGHERGWVRAASIGATALGVVLLVVGGMGFVSARSTDDEAQATKDRVEELRVETSALEEESDAAREEADAALAEVTRLEDAGDAVFEAVDAAEDAMNASSEAGNVISGCRQLDLDAYVQCTGAGLEGLRTANTALAEATARVHEEIEALGEELR